MIYLTGTATSASGSPASWSVLCSTCAPAGPCWSGREIWARILPRRGLQFLISCRNTAAPWGARTTRSRCSPGPAHPPWPGCARLSAAAARPRCRWDGPGSSCGSWTRCWIGTTHLHDTLLSVWRFRSGCEETFKGNQKQETLAHLPDETSYRCRRRRRKAIAHVAMSSMISSSLASQDLQM